MLTRSITGLFIVAGFVSALYIGGGYLKAILLLMALFMSNEMMKMIKMEKSYFFGMIHFLLIVSFLFIPIPKTAIWMMTMYTAFLMYLFTKRSFSSEQIGLYVLAIPYISFGLFSLWVIQTDYSFYLVVLPYALICLNDTFAYLTGRQFGKRKIAPMISPNKTVEGSAGGFAVTVAVSLLMEWQFPLFHSYGLMFLFSSMIAVFGQAGDLAESALKRRLGVKDSGNILPGHGGFLDRFDSTLFVYPLVLFFYSVIL